MPCPLIGPFIFRDLVCHNQVVDPGLVLCVVLILPCRSFRPSPWCWIEWPFTYLVRWLPCISITALQNFICVITVVQCLLSFQSGLPDIESNQQAQYYSYSSIHSYTSQCGGQLSIPGSVASGVALLPQMTQAAFQLWDLPEVDLLASSCTTQYQHYYTFETPLPLGALGLNAFNHPWKFQVSYVFPPLALVSLVLSKFLVEHVKGQLRLLILVAPC